MARCRKEWYLYISLFVILTKIYSILATARFTQFPPNVSYVSSGGTARFVWDYHVDNRLWEFLSESPVWYFINQATHSESIIGADDRETNNWSFVINEATCPPRLLNPDRVSRESNATLVITDVTIADNGIYKCSLKLKLDQAIDHQLQLVVTVRPTFLPSHPNNTYQIIEGQDLKINCTAIGSPTPDIAWVNITDGSVVIKSQGSGSAVLQIDNIRRYHAGVYECQAKNNPNEAATTTRTSVTIYYSPKITHFSDDMMINEGSLIELTCSAFGYPQPNITWSKGSLLQYGNSLIIPSATRKDTGNYTCTAKNFYGTREHLVKANIFVTVRYKPSIVLWTKEQIIIETNPLHLTCIADGYPAPNITWTKSPGIMTPSVPTGNEYSIQKANRSDAGTYKCTASNEIGSDKKNISVVVQYKPTILKEESSSNLTSWNGRQVTLNCTVVDGEPLPDITWYKPSGDKIKNGVTAIAKKSQVVITTKEGADYGLYECKAKNVAGSVKHNVIVTQLFPPDIPNVTILDQDIQASSVTVKWIKPGYDGGSPVIGYKVQINSTNPPKEQNTAKTEHEFTGLTKNTRYELRVYARNVVGHGNASIVVFTTKKRGPPPLPSLYLRKSKTTIILSWTRPDENGGTIESYTIYQKQGVQKTWTSMHVVRDLSNLTYVLQLEDLEPGQTYWFIVTATNELGESEIGSSDKGKEAYVLPKVTTANQIPTTESVPNKNERKSGGDDKASPIVIAAAVGAAVLFLIAAVIIVIILRKKNILGRGTIKSKRSDRAAYHNDIDPDNVTQQGAAASLGGVDDGIPTYAAVDISKKKKKNVQDTLPNYAAVDKTKKKRPGEIIYAELADFNSPGTTVEEPRPITYTGTDYADISQFQKQDEPEPTYANFTGQSKKFTNIQDK